LQMAERWCEVRIGQLLGPGVSGQHIPPSPMGEGAGEISLVAKDDRYKCRLMAGCLAIVEEAMLTAGLVTRNKILDRIKAWLNREYLKRCAGLEVEGFHHGDFRTVANLIPDGMVHLIFTDPPYDRASLPLYGDLARIAAAKLIDGGSLICYAGQYQINRV